MKKLFNNPDFSLIKFITFVVVSIALPVGVLFGAQTKAFQAWLASANLAWLWVLSVVILAVLAVGWLTETAAKKPRVVASVAAALAVVATTVVVLNWKSIAAAFSAKNYGISLIMLVFIAGMTVLAVYMATNTKPKNPNATTTRRGA